MSDVAIIRSHRKVVIDMWSAGPSVQARIRARVDAQSERPRGL